MILFVLIIHQLKRQNGLLWVFFIGIIPSIAKLIVTKNETIGTSRVVYKVQYTYKDNPRFEEINPQTIKEYFENVYDYSCS